MCNEILFYECIATMEKVYVIVRAQQLDRVSKEASLTITFTAFSCVERDKWMEAMHTATRCEKRKKNFRLVGNILQSYRSCNRIAVVFCFVCWWSGRQQQQNEIGEAI